MVPVYNPGRYIEPGIASILGQTLSGNFTFEQVTTTGGDRIVRVAATEVSMFLGDPGSTPGGGNDSDEAGVLVSDGAGFFVISPAGVASASGSGSASR